MLCRSVPAPPPPILGWRRASFISLPVRPPLIRANLRRACAAAAFSTSPHTGLFSTSAIPPLLPGPTTTLFQRTYPPSKDQLVKATAGTNSDLTNSDTASYNPASHDATSGIYRWMYNTILKVAGVFFLVSIVLNSSMMIYMLIFDGRALLPHPPLMQIIEVVFRKTAALPYWIYGVREVVRCFFPEPQ